MDITNSSDPLPALTFKMTLLEKPIVPKPLTSFLV